MSVRAVLKRKVLFTVNVMLVILEMDLIVLVSKFYISVSNVFGCFFSVDLSFVIFTFHL
jgi:hypothetical protein